MNYWVRSGKHADPYGRVVTISYDPNGNKTITEPGGRWIRETGFEGGQVRVTTSLGQSVTYLPGPSSGSYVSDGGDGSYGPNILTNEEIVRYDDVVDPATGQPVQAHYIYKLGLPFLRILRVGVGTRRLTLLGRLVWASDPMFDGPLQQVRYIYTDHPSDSNGDYAPLTAVEGRALRDQRGRPRYYGQPL